MPCQISSYALEITPRNRPSAIAYSGAVIGAAFGLKIVTIANPSATNTETQAQPGSCTRPAVVVSTWFHPTAPAARSSSHRNPVFANVPPTVMVRVSAGAAGGRPISVAAAAPAGDAQP